jgi:hypothetical protein
MFKEFDKVPSLMKALLAVLFFIPPLIFIPSKIYGQSFQNNFDIYNPTAYKIIDYVSAADKDIYLDYPKEPQKIVVLDADLNQNDYKLSDYGKKLIKQIAIELLRKNETSVVVRRRESKIENIKLTQLRMVEIAKEFEKYGVTIRDEIELKSKPDTGTKIEIKLLIKD